MLSYIETHAVIARLNEGCDAWSFEIVRHEIHDAEVVVLGKLTADGVVKTAFGGSAITRGQDGEPVSLADDLKSATSDAIKKAASLLGVGLELYGGGGGNGHGEKNGSGDGVRPASGNGGVNGGGYNAGHTDRLTARQLAAIHGAARRNNVSREGVMKLVQARGRRQLESLTRSEASEIISELNERGDAHA
jgi:hypothetical protein